MARYHFVTVWHVEAPIERVWSVINDTEGYPAWWKDVQSATRLEAGDDSGIGARYRLTWVTHLPYKLVFEARTIRREPPRLLELESKGELDGTGLWELSPEGEGTLVRYTWDIETTKAWMNLLAPIARPLFSWNHNAVMKDGAEGLARLLNAQVTGEEA